MAKSILRKTRKMKKSHKRQRKTRFKRKNYKQYGGDINSNYLHNYDINIQNVLTAATQYSGKHFINTDAANEFIEGQITELRRRTARDLIENTTYITLNDIMDITEQLILRLYKENDFRDKDIYIFCSNTNKSFYFMSVIGLYFIKKHGLKEPSSFIQKIDDDLLDRIGDSPIIIIDDVSYSGTQLSNMLSNIYYGRVITSSKIVPNIFILINALNYFSKDKLEQVSTRKTRSGIFYDPIKSPFKLLYLDERLYEPLILKLGFERFFYLNIFFSVFTQGTPHVSIYLDHKMADEVSTYKFALLYGPIVPSSYDYVRLIQNRFLNSQTNIFYINPKYNNIIVTRFNDDNITNFTNDYDMLSKIIKFLFHKNTVLDTPTATNNIHINTFKPFITGSKSNVNIITNIADSEIKYINYKYLLVPKDCFKSPKECSTISSIIVDFDDNDNYIEERPESHEEVLALESHRQVLANLSRINDKLYNVNFPIQWYKAGPLQMV